MVGEILLTNDPTENRRKLAPLPLELSALLAPATLLGLEVGDTPKDRVERRSAMGAALVSPLLYHRSFLKGDDLSRCVCCVFCTAGQCRKSTLT
jgi:hypothetical protein